MASALSCALLLLLVRSCVAGEEGSEVCRLGFYGERLPDGAPQCLDEADAKICCAAGETCPDLLPCPVNSPRKAGAGRSPAEETSRSLLSISGVSAQELGSPVDTTGSRGDSVEGEQCHKWLPGQEAPIESFWCPTQYNGQGDQFCCGTCAASHCCSSAKDRLDQASCSRGTQSTAAPAGGQEEGGTAQPLPEEPASVNYAALALIVSGLAGFSIWIIYVGRHFRDRLTIRNWLRAGNRDRGGIEFELPAEAAAVDPPRPAASGSPILLPPGATDAAVVDPPKPAASKNPHPLSQWATKVAATDFPRTPASKNPPPLSPGATELAATDSPRTTASENPPPLSPGATELAATDSPRTTASENPPPLSPGATELAATDSPRTTASENPPPLSPGATEPDILTEAVATDPPPAASEDAPPLPPGAEDSHNLSEPLSALNNPPDLPASCQHSGSPVDEGMILPVVLPEQDLCPSFEEADTAL